jgi:hypothetical protein
LQYLTYTIIECVNAIIKTIDYVALPSSSQKLTLRILINGHLFSVSSDNAKGDLTFEGKPYTLSATFEFVNNRFLSLDASNNHRSVSGSDSASVEVDNLHTIMNTFSKCLSFEFSTHEEQLESKQYSKFKKKEEGSDFSKAQMSYIFVGDGLTVDIISEIPDLFGTDGQIGLYKVFIFDEKICVNTFEYAFTKNTE